MSTITLADTLEALHDCGLFPAQVVAEAEAELTGMFGDDGTLDVESAIHNAVFASAIVVALQLAIDQAERAAAS